MISIPDTLEIILSDALSSCLNLKFFELRHSKIAEIPSTLFNSNKKLTSIYISHSPVKQIPAEIFGGLSNLQSVSLNNLLIDEFPVEVVARSLSRDIKAIHVWSNYLKDLDVDYTLWFWPLITSITYDDNEIKCDRVEVINTFMRENGLTSIIGFEPRARTEPTETRDGVICIP